MLDIIEVLLGDLRDLIVWYALHIPQCLLKNAWSFGVRRNKHISTLCMAELCKYSNLQILILVHVLYINVNSVYIVRFFFSFISVYLSSLPVAYLSDAPRGRLVVTGDSERVQDETD